MSKNKKQDKLKLKVKENILQIFRNAGQQKLNYKQISSKLQSTQPHERMLVSSVLKQLANDGLINDLGRGKYISVKKDKVSVEGNIEITRNGTGYLTSDLFETDIYIAPRYTGKAMNSDLVLVEIDPNKRKLSGKVLKVLERKRDTFVGLVEMGKNHAFVIPDDYKLNVDFYVSTGNLKGAKDGDKVIVKITGWPEQANNPVAEVLNVLGKSGDHNVEMHAILFEYGLPLDFPDKVKQAAASVSEGITSEEISKRKDYRSITTFTIDPVDAKDFDDALSIEFLKNGNYRVGVHIADVSHYVTPGSVIDKEAWERSTSVYLVDRVVPMLPEILSNVVCSLRPNEDKLTFSAIFDINKNADILNVWIGKTIIHSNKRFTYEEAQEIIEGKKSKLSKEILSLDKLAKQLRVIRFDHGSIDFGSSEVRFQLDENGFPVGIQKKEMKDSNKLVEEFMLLANKKISESVGKLQKGQTLKPFVYRVHDSPDPIKLETLSTFAHKFGYTIIRVKGKGAATAINRLINASQGQPEEDLIRTMAIRSMAKAIYTVKNIGHYGLAFDHYSHFTSPIRRYPDLVVHRLLDAYNHNKNYSNFTELENMCKHASLNEKRAAIAERASIKYKQVEYMSKYIGKEFSGMITGITNWGIYVEVLDGLCEGMVSITSLKDDNYYFNEKEFVIKGSKHGHEYNIGDKVLIKVLRTDIYRRQIDFQMIE
jgi:ribonuclease R